MHLSLQAAALPEDIQPVAEQQAAALKAHRDAVATPAARGVADSAATPGFNGAQESSTALPLGGSGGDLGAKGSSGGGDTGAADNKGRAGGGGGGGGGSPSPSAQDSGADCVTPGSVRATRLRAFLEQHGGWVIACNTLVEYGCNDVTVNALDAEDFEGIMSFAREHGQQRALPALRILRGIICPGAAATPGR